MYDDACAGACAGAGGACGACAGAATAATVDAENTSLERQEKLLAKVKKGKLFWNSCTPLGDFE